MDATLPILERSRYFVTRIYCIPCLGRVALCKADSAEAPGVSCWKSSEKERKTLVAGKLRWGLRVSAGYRLCGMDFLRDLLRFCYLRKLFYSYIVIGLLHLLHGVSLVARGSLNTPMVLTSDTSVLLIL